MVKSSWKMWGRPLICKTGLQLTEVDPSHSHTSQYTLYSHIQSTLIHCTIPPRLWSSLTWACQVRRRLSFKVTVSKMSMKPGFHWSPCSLTEEDKRRAGKREEKLFLSDHHLTGGTCSCDGSSEQEHTMGHPGNDIQMEMTALFMWVENGFSLAASINHPEIYVLLFWWHFFPYFSLLPSTFRT